MGNNVGVAVCKVSYDMPPKEWWVEACKNTWSFWWKYRWFTFLLLTFSYILFFFSKMDEYSVFFKKLKNKKKINLSHSVVCEHFRCQGPTCLVHWSFPRHFLRKQKKVCSINIYSMLNELTMMYFLMVWSALDNVKVICKVQEICFLEKKVREAKWRNTK